MRIALLNLFITFENNDTPYSDTLPTGNMCAKLHLNKGNIPGDRLVFSSMWPGVWMTPSKPSMRIFLVTSATISDVLLITPRRPVITISDKRRKT